MHIVGKQIALFLFFLVLTNNYYLTQSPSEGDKLYKQGVDLAQQKKFDKALEKYFQSIDLANEDSALKARVYNRIGVVYGRIDDHLTAYDFFIKCIELSKQINLQSIEMSAKNNLANTLLMLGKSDSALQLKEEVYEYSLTHPTEVSQDLIKVNLATSYAERGNYTKAESYFLSFIESQKTDSLTNLLGVAQMNLSQLYGLKKEWQKAIEYGKSAEQTFLFTKNQKDLAQVYKNLKGYFENLNQTKKALAYSNKFIDLKDELEDSYNQADLRQIKTNYDKKLREEELKNKSLMLEITKKEKQLITRKLFFIISVSSLILVLAIVIYLYQRKKIKNNLEIINDIAERINNESKNQAINQRKIEKLTKDLIQKEEKIKSFENHLLSKQKREANTLAEMIKRGLKTEEDWTVFLTEFNLEYKLFLDDLTTKTTLSKNDVKILALQKLKLTTNEMALVMNITLGGVKKARNRLREKLNLPEEVTLNEFVSKI